MPKVSAWKLWTLQLELVVSVMAEVEPLVRAHGLETKEVFLLGKVDEHPNPAALARALITPKATITFLVKRMEAAGYLRRETQADDLRRFRLTLTPAGRSAMEATRAIIEEAFGKRIGRLTAGERGELARVLERMGGAG